MITDQTLLIKTKQMIINARNLLAKAETIIDVMWSQNAADDTKIDTKKKQLPVNERGE